MGRELQPRRGHEGPLTRIPCFRADRLVSANSGHTAVVSWRAEKARCPTPGRSSPPSMLLASITAAVHGFMTVEKVLGGAQPG